MEDAIRTVWTELTKKQPVPEAIPEWGNLTEEEREYVWQQVGWLENSLALLMNTFVADRQRAQFMQSITAEPDEEAG